MPNIAGKAFAMNLVTPIERLQSVFNRARFWAIRQPLFRFSLRGLETLSMIHYARWVILQPRDWPRLHRSQPREKLHYAYQLFFSNFNGSWAQYVDSSSAAIPSGLDLLWHKNVGWPTSVPEQPFHRYVEHNEVWTSYYYSAYPMAAANDVKSARRVLTGLQAFVADAEGLDAGEFERRYDALLNQLQHDLSQLGPSPVVSLASQAIEERTRVEAAEYGVHESGPAPSMGGQRHAE